MKFLLTNDDGIDAPGLRALQEALASVAETAVVAPHQHLSGCSHQVSNDRPLQPVQLAEDRFAVDGTPADCVRLGLLHLSPDVDWVMSGINDGANLGVDVYMSGTVAAVREAALFGKPAVAFSQYRRDRSAEPGDDAWQESAALVRRALDFLREYELEPGSFWNVNFPDGRPRNGEPEIVRCPLEELHLPVRYDVEDGRFHYRGPYHDRPRRRGSDVDVCFSGHIAVTQVRLDRSMGPTAD